MKELSDAERMQRQFMDCAFYCPVFLYGGCWCIILLGSSIGVESAAFPGQSQEEIDRLLHMVRLEIAFCISDFDVLIGCGWRRSNGHWTQVYNVLSGVIRYTDYVSAVANSTISLR